MSDWQKKFADTVSCLPACCNENTGNKKIPRREKNDLKDTNSSCSKLIWTKVLALQNERIVLNSNVCIAE